jgi:hypothetical protein
MPEVPRLVLLLKEQKIMIGSTDGPTCKHGWNAFMRERCPEFLKEEAEARSQLDITALARDYAERCGWKMVIPGSSETGWRRVHEDDLTKAFLAFAKEINKRAAEVAELGVLNLGGQTIGGAIRKLVENG